ncbi:MAG: apolipoprotein N-acyltransferase [Planctomycetes bacterium]|nr:apolipoprotein N-acyltransferase [Planctomycetota bacterium]
MTSDDTAAARAGGSPSAVVWGLAIGGGLGMFLCQPPADLWPLAWLAPLPWLALVTDPRHAAVRPWLTAWAGGLAYWLPAIHWLRLPHPATGIGWVVLSAYLACYAPLFIWAARRLVHHWRWPLVPASVVAWLACEHLRGRLLGGFTLAGLGHTQWRWTTLIQAADAVGEVGVAGIVMAGAAGVASVLSAALGRTAVRRAFADVAVAVAVLAASLAYGQWRLATAPRPAHPPLDVLLVQGSIDTELKHDPESASAVLAEYDDLTTAALDAAGQPRLPDLIVWPETMWRWGLVELDPAELLPAAVLDELIGPPVADELAGSADRQARGREALARQRFDALAARARRYGTNWVVGLDRQRITPSAVSGAEHYNAALVLDAAGRRLACYDKMYPVMFGEYVPLADRFPFLYRLTPLPAGLTAGTTPVAVEIAGFDVAPTICYETALPAAIRTIVRRLAATGRRPDVLVNLTNDGWFWGSSELDMHLAAGIFRAVEVRTPLVIAANTGFSASIDGSGRLLARGPRRAKAVLRVAVHPDGRGSPWLSLGTLPAWLTLAVVAMLAMERLVGLRLASPVPGGRQ